MNNYTKPLLSVCIITYNHELYIKKAIQSVLGQKCNFNIELVIGEDFSTDNTRKICEEIVKNEDSVILLPNNSNLGVIPNLIRTLSSCNSKYIAFCEGDDYWTDEFKLQKQVEILETNPRFSLCFHDALVVWENGSKSPQSFCKNLSKNVFTIEDIINNWLIPSASMVFRKELLFPLPNWFKDIYNGDYAIQLLLASKGDFFYINQVMSVYRQHETNLSANAKSIRINREIVKLFQFFDNHSDYLYTHLVNVKLKKLAYSYKIYKFKKIVYSMPKGEYLWNFMTGLFKSKEG